MGFAALLAAILLKRGRVLLILLIFFSVGALRYLNDQKADSELIRILQEKGSVQQQMQYRVETKLADSVFQAELHNIAGVDVREKILLFSDQELKPGHSYASLALLQALVQDPVLDIYPKRFNAFLRPVLPPIDLLRQQRGYIYQARTWVQSRLDKSLGPYSPLAKAFLLSDTGFKRENRMELSRAGITHLIVVSGLHVVMLSLLVMLILRFFLPMRMAEMLFMAFLFFFAALNNWAPPILRAMLMIDLLILARWLSRPLSAAQSLSVALFIITLVNPGELFELGLQLSFISVGLIIFALPHRSQQETGAFVQRTLKQVGHYMLICLVVGLGIAPFSLYYFGSASLNGILGNLLGLPLMTILLGLSLLCLFFPIPVFILSFQAVADLWKWWLLLCSGLPLYVDSSWLSLAQAFALGLTVWLILLALKGRFRLLWKAAIPVVPTIAILLFLPVQRKAEVHIFNAGVADCSLIFADDGSSLMIDTGGIPGHRAETDLQEQTAEDSWMRQKLQIWLGRNKIRHLDYLLLTHLHSDHAGGLRSLLQSTNVSNLIISQNDLQSEIWRAIEAGLNLERTRIIALTDTMSIVLGTHRLKILHPTTQYRDSRMNNHSIVCRYDAGELSFLFTGDIEQEAETWLVNCYPQELKADILKVAHHGSRSSSTDLFLRQVKPSEAVFTTTKHNIYGFPHPETIARLRNHDVRLHFTYNGSVSFTTD